MKQFLFLALILPLFGCSRGPSPEAQRLYKEGFERYLNKHYTEALPLFARASELGSGAADCDLGVMYELGYGVPANLSEAFRCFARGANRGDNGSQYRVGRCYQEGIGVPMDKKKALFWYRRAAAQENELASYAIDDLEREGYK